jgi:single-stranded DNA-specific DHH superfamily exonuclease
LAVDSRSGAARADEIVWRILAGRGIVTADAIEEFLSDKPKCTYDPLLLPDMEAGVDLIYSSLKSGKRICIYGDYDVDGIMSTVLLYRYFNALPDICPDLMYYIPSRFDEGYGLNADALRTVREAGAELVVTVDCGSVSKAEVAYAQTIGLCVVVTDHHDCEPELRPDCIVINPKREDSAYPWRHLSGCGVAFKVAQTIKQRYYAKDASVAAALNASLDLTAIATVADVMPLADENRTLVKYGLNFLNNGSRLPLKKLALSIGLTLGEISAHNISFGIAPHINAVGRMADAGPAVELFLTENESRMDEIIEELIRCNGERREIQDQLTNRCIEMVESRYAGDHFLLLRPPGVHEGVSGIVAGKIKDRFGLPTAVLAETDRYVEMPENTETDRNPATPKDAAMNAETEMSENAAMTCETAMPEDAAINCGIETSADADSCGGGTILKGSARGVPGVDIIAMLRRHSELFLKLGGHAMAAGFALRAENEERLRMSLNDDMDALLDEAPDLLTKNIMVDAEPLPQEITQELADRMKRFEPTGAGNPKPRIRIASAVVSKVKYMGNAGQHMRFTASGVPCVLFGSAKEYAGIIAEGNRISVIGTVEINTWNGNSSVQMIVRDVSTAAPV